ncbi:hypothetical protein L2E82_38392 [Cichorium intybus]|uniref:Uncharacterized protein n=1 Tax=Cichorium intybus TaxID=13427 RepID=A0ACB9AK97_CICIN|nr:hypothetical protein L2E82_38392 [Cichorium intybus]
MDRRKRSRAEAHPHRNDITKELLPDIAFLNILSRLPVKSVGRFTCVSKQWHSFLTTPEFVKTHRQHVITNKMVLVSAATKWFHTIDCERPKEGFSAGRPFPFKVGPSQNIRILTSVHGLKTTWLSFTLRDGCLHLWVNIADSLTFTSENELWRMDEDGNWTKVVNSGRILSNSIYYYHRLHLMKNGNMLICREGCVYELDIKTHTIVLSSNTNENMLGSPGGKYIETLVSPNQYMK